MINMIMNWLMLKFASTLDIVQDGKVIRRYTLINSYHNTIFLDKKGKMKAFEKERI
jgi:hypothetical protein